MGLNNFTGKNGSKKKATGGGPVTPGSLAALFPGATIIGIPPGGSGGITVGVDKKGAIVVTDDTDDASGAGGYDDDDS